MPYASEVRGKYTPHPTNKTPLERQTSSTLNNEYSNFNETRVSDSTVIEEKTDASSTIKFWTKRKKIIALIGGSLLLLIIAAAITIPLVLTLNGSNSSTSTASTSSTTFGNTTTVTTTTATTVVPNPCSPGGLSWSTTGITILNSSQLTGTNGIYIDSYNTLYIADEYPNSVVWKFPLNATNATLVSGYQGSLGSSSNRFNYPQDVYADPYGNIYVTDYNNYRVQEFSNGSSMGTTIAGITGSSGSGLSQFNGVRNFYIDPTNTYMYVTDFYNHRVMRYLTNSTSGNNGVLVAGGNGGGFSNTTLYYPWGIYSNPSISNDLFISNYYSHSIIRWTPGATSGYYIAGIPGTAGQSPVLLNYPTAIRIDSYMNVFFADSGNHRIQLFCPNSQTGITIAGTGVAGNSATQLNGPRSMAFDSSMNLYVSDSQNYRIQKFLRL